MTQSWPDNIRLWPHIVRHEVETKLSDDCTSRSLIKFQKTPNMQAVQLIIRDIYKLVSNNNLEIMIISADHWVSLLP